MRLSTSVRRLPWIGAAAFLLASVGPAFLAPTPTFAVDDGDSRVTSSATTTYQVVPGKGYVLVTIVQKITNHTPSKSSSYDCSVRGVDPYYGPYEIKRTCRTTTRYYYNGWGVVTEAGATNVKVRVTGGSATIKRTKKAAFYDNWLIRIPNTFNGQSRTITTTYRLPGKAPRSTDTTRINGAYLSFFGIAQYADSASVRVLVPAAFETTTSGGPITQAADHGGYHVYTSGKVADPDKWYVGITGTNDAGRVHQSLTSANGRPIEIEGWPGDKAWMNAVHDEASNSISELEELIGRQLPGNGPVRIDEVSGTELGDAYIGTYDNDTRIATVSEDFTQAGTVAHELSHVWFNSDLFTANWLSEGYASWAERAVGANKTDCKPGSYPGTGKPNLELWRQADPRATQEQLDIVDYQYDAACKIITDTVARIGTDGMRDALAVLMTADAAYPGTKDAKLGGKVDWRQWLDAVDERGALPADVEDTKTFADLLRTYGIATDVQLKGRADARTHLDATRDAVTEVGGGWAVPAGVYTSMRDWKFDDAEALMTEAEAVMATATEIEGVLPVATVAASPFAAQVAAATSIEGLRKVHADASARLESVKAATAAVAGAQARAHAELGPIEQVGLMGTDPVGIADAAQQAVDTDDLDGATAKIAELDAVLASASPNGTTRVGGVTGVVVALLLLLAFLVWRRRRGSRGRAEPAAATASAAASMAVADPSFGPATDVPATDVTTAVPIADDPTVVTPIPPEDGSG
jgi:hypothetical protein